MIKTILRKVRQYKKNHACRIIFDFEKRLGYQNNKPTQYRTDYCKEAISREYVLNPPSQEKLNFLDVGGGEGDLAYLLGISKNLVIDQKVYEQNKTRFNHIYNYYSLDIQPRGEKVIYGDVCETQFINNWQTYVEAFDVIYSNNVFEHLQKPRLLKIKTNILC